MNQETTVGISEASRILGVSEASLRQWTGEGKIKAFITPGGHRRYSKSELKKFMSVQQKSLGVKDLATKLEESVPQHREAVSTFLKGSAWYTQLAENSQEDLSTLGRGLLNLIIKSATEPAHQEATLKEIRGVGYRFGEVLAVSGLPLTDSVQAFIQHRDLVTGIVTRLMQKREGLNLRIVDAIPLIDRAMDEALLSLVEAHQKYKTNNLTVGKSQ